MIFLRGRFWHSHDCRSAHIPKLVNYDAININLENMNKDKHILLLLSIVSSVSSGSAETADFNFSNRPGNDAVGFRVVMQYDYSRSYRRKVDNMGKSFYGELARPVQTLIWYPAQQSAAAHITFGDYLNLAATQDDFKPSPEQTASALAFAKKQFNASPSAAMWAIADAMPQPGKFPVIIYAASFNAPAFENADLCEYSYYLLHAEGNYARINCAGQKGYIRQCIK